MNKFGELATYYQKKGLRETLERIRNRYFSVVTFIHYQRDLSEPFQQVVPDGDIEVVVNNFDLLNQERSSRNDLPREFFIDKTHHGRYFYLLYFQGNLAGICWIFKKGDYSRFFKIENGANCELNYIITLPDFRGHRLSSLFTNHICENLKDQKVNAVFLSVSRANVLSHKTFIGAGFSEYMRVQSYFSWVRKIKV